MGSGISLDAYLNFHAGLMELLDLTEGKRAYEVGCGSGANLYLMQHEGLTVGGADYAEGLVETARTVVPAAHEMNVTEAAEIPTDEKYDAVFSNSVFSYFPDHVYATRVLERMLAKSTHAIGITDLHDRAKRQDYLTFRRANSRTMIRATRASPASFSAVLSSRTSRAYMISTSHSPHSNSTATGTRRLSFMYSCIGDEP